MNYLLILSLSCSAYLLSNFMNSRYIAIKRGESFVCENSIFQCIRKSSFNYHLYNLPRGGNTDISSKNEEKSFLGTLHFKNITITSKHPQPRHLNRKTKYSEINAESVIQGRRRKIGRKRRKKRTKDDNSNDRDVYANIEHIPQYSNKRHSKHHVTCPKGSKRGGSIREDCFTQHSESVKTKGAKPTSKPNAFPSSPPTSTPSKIPHGELSPVQNASAQRIFVANMQRYPKDLFWMDTAGQIILWIDESISAATKRGVDGKKRILMELKDIRGLQKDCKKCGVQLYEGHSCEKVINEDGKSILYDRSSEYLGTFSTTNEGVANAQFTSILEHYRPTMVAVLYTSTNVPISCGVFQEGSSLYVANSLFANVYSGYRTQNPSPSGSVTLHFFPETERYSFVMRYNLYGMDPHCRACPIRIHAGMSCEGKVGKPHQTGSSAWDDSTFSTDGMGRAQGEQLLLITENDGFFDNYGHVVVMENSKKVPIACGELRYRQGIDEITDLYLTAPIENHPANPGPTIPNGYIHVLHMESRKKGEISINIQADLTNLEENSCRTPNCGSIVIHKGRSCESVESIGEAYYEGMENEIWTKMGGFDVIDGQTLSTFTIKRRGLPSSVYMDHIGLTIVVKNSNNIPVGCGTLQSGRLKSIVNSSLRATMSTIPGYVGPLRPEGVIKLEFDTKIEATMLMTMSVTGLEYQCIKGCMVQINVGKSCKNPIDISTTRGNRNDNGNPWVHEFYTTYGGATTSSFKINNGDFGFQDYLGHTIILQASDKTPLSCGVLHSEDTRMEGNALVAEIMENPSLPNDDTGMSVGGFVKLRFLNDRSVVLNYDVLVVGCPDCFISIRNSVDCSEQNVAYEGFDSTSAITTDKYGNGRGELILREVGDDFTVVKAATLIASLLDGEGKAIGCGNFAFGRFLDGTKKLEASVQRYKDYVPDNNMGDPHGSVTLFQDGRSGAIFINLNLIDMPNCFYNNGCPQHIHESDTCENPGLLIENRIPRYFTNKQGREIGQYQAIGLSNSIDYIFYNRSIVFKTSRMKIAACGILRSLDQTENPIEFKHKLLMSSESNEAGI